MERYTSHVNGGETVILQSHHEAVELTTGYLDQQIKNLRRAPKGTRFNVQRISRGVMTMKPMAASTFLKKTVKSRTGFLEAANSINTVPTPARDRINDLTQKLVDRLVESCPMLQVKPMSWARCEDGPIAAPELIDCEDDRPCFTRSNRSYSLETGAADGAFRVIVSTDEIDASLDRAAIVAAMILALQTVRPVELWIQQGWFGGGGSGVTLFKVDFEGAFDPSHLYFWLANSNVDHEFSVNLSFALGRCSHQAAHLPELKCDFFLHRNNPGRPIIAACSNDLIGPAALWLEKQLELDLEEVA